MEIRQAWLSCRCWQHEPPRFKDGFEMELEVKDNGLKPGNRGEGWCSPQLWLHFKFQVAKWNHSRNEVEYHLEWSWNEAILRAKCPAFEGLAPLSVRVWGQITMCDWQLYQAKPQAWPSDPSARVAAFASRCEGLGWAMYGYVFILLTQFQSQWTYMTKPNAYKGWWLVKELLGNFNCNPSRWAAHCAHTLSCRVTQLFLWFHMSQRLGTGHVVEKDGQTRGKYLLVALAWLPLTDTAGFVLLLILLENQRSAAFSAGKLSEIFCVEFEQTLHVSDIVCSACDKPATWNLARVKGEWLDEAKGENHRVWLENRKATWKMASCNAMRGAHVKVVTVETETDLNMSRHPAILVQGRSKESRRLWAAMDTNSYDPPYQALFELWIEDWWWHVMMWFLVCWCS